jgi:hypothetical protein
MRRRHVDCVWMAKSDDGRRLGEGRGVELMGLGRNGFQERRRIDFDEMGGDRIGEEIVVKQR